MAENNETVSPKQRGNGTVSPKQRRLVTGIVLVALGVVLFALHLAEGPEEYTALFVIGSVFLAGYFYRNVYGLLIPGCILLGIGIGLVADNINLPVRQPEPVGLGVGFLSIYLIDTVTRGRSPWWPLIPGLILIIVGAGPDIPDPGRVISIGWPLILVVVGLLVIARAVMKGKQTE